MPKNLQSFSHKVGAFLRISILTEGWYLLNWNMCVTKFILHIVALLLVPCLIMDPSLAAALPEQSFATPFQLHVDRLIEHRASLAVNNFNEQALQVSLAGARFSGLSGFLTSFKRRFAGLVHRRAIKRGKHPPATAGREAKDLAGMQTSEVSLRQQTRTRHGEDIELRNPGRRALFKRAGLQVVLNSLPANAPPVEQIRRLTDEELKNVIPPMELAPCTNLAAAFQKVNHAVDELAKGTEGAEEQYSDAVQELSRANAAWSAEARGLFREASSGLRRIFWDYLRFQEENYPRLLQTLAERKSSIEAKAANDFAQATLASPRYFTLHRRVWELSRVLNRVGINADVSAGIQDIVSSTGQVLDQVFPAANRNLMVQPGPMLQQTQQLERAVENWVTASLAPSIQAMAKEVPGFLRILPDGYDPYNLDVIVHLFRHYWFERANSPESFRQLVHTFIQNELHDYYEKAKRHLFEDLNSRVGHSQTSEDYQSVAGFGEWEWPFRHDNEAGYKLWLEEGRTFLQRMKEQMLSNRGLSTLILILFIGKGPTVNVTAPHIVTSAA